MPREERERHSNARIRTQLPPRRSCWLWNVDCEFWPGCKNKDECHFRHPSDEGQVIRRHSLPTGEPIWCRFKERCSRIDCWFWHPGDGETYIAPKGHEVPEKCKEVPKQSDDGKQRTSLPRTPKESLSREQMEQIFAQLEDYDAIPEPPDEEREKSKEPEEQIAYRPRADRSPGKENMQEGEPPKPIAVSSPVRQMAIPPGLVQGGPHRRSTTPELSQPTQYPNKSASPPAPQKPAPAAPGVIGLERKDKGLERQHTFGSFGWFAQAIGVERNEEPPKDLKSPPRLSPIHLPAGNENKEIGDLLAELNKDSVALTSPGSKISKPKAKGGSLLIVEDNNTAPHLRLGGVSMLNEQSFPRKPLSPTDSVIDIGELDLLGDLRRSRDSRKRSGSSNSKWGGMPGGPRQEMQQRSTGLNHVGYGSQIIFGSGLPRVNKEEGFQKPLMMNPQIALPPNMRGKSGGFPRYGPASQPSPPIGLPGMQRSATPPAPKLGFFSLDHSANNRQKPKRNGFSLFG